MRVKSVFCFPSVFFIFSFPPELSGTAARNIARNFTTGRSVGQYDNL